MTEFSNNHIEQHAPGKNRKERLAWFTGLDSSSRENAKSLLLEKAELEEKRKKSRDWENLTKIGTGAALIAVLLFVPNPVSGYLAALAFAPQAALDFSVAIALVGAAITAISSFTPEAIQSCAFVIGKGKYAREDKTRKLDRALKAL